MIYSNINLTLETRKMSFGDLKCITLGEKGRGRKEILLPSLSNITVGLNKDLTIGLTKNGRPRINKVNPKKDNTLYILLDTYGGYSRRGDGVISFREEQGFEIIAEGNGADGDAGRIGSWGVYVIKAPVDDKMKIIKIKYSGKANKIAYIAVIGQDVRLINEDDIDIFFDQLDLDINDYKFILDSRPLSVPYGCICGDMIYTMEYIVNKDTTDQFYIGDKGELRHRDSILVPSSTRIDENHVVEVFFDENHSEEDFKFNVYKVNDRYYYPISDWEKEMLVSKFKLGY